MIKLRRQLWLLAFFDEFLPLYALFALWFEDNGISTSRISLLFALWAATALVLEVPSGALADRMDKRSLIAIAYACRMAGIALWLIQPTFGGVLAGVVLWATHDALASGAWEAMIYEELDHLGAADRYASTMARLAQAAWIAVAGAAVAAWLLVPLVGVAGVGWTSIGLLTIAVVLVIRLPDVGPGPDPSAIDQADDEDVTAFDEWWFTLKHGVASVRTEPVLLRLVVLGSLIESLTLFEEYIPFLARRSGATDRVVPIILGLAWLGFVAGAELAARRPDLGSRVQAGLMTMGVVMAAVAIQGSGSPYLVVALAFLHLSTQTTMVLSDARIQERAADEVRATIVSVRGFLTEVAAMIIFVMMSVLDRAGDVRPGLIVLLIAAAIAVPLIDRWMPATSASRR